LGGHFQVASLNRKPETEKNFSDAAHPDASNADKVDACICEQYRHGAIQDFLNGVVKGSMIAPMRISLKDIPSEGIAIQANGTMDWVKAVIAKAAHPTAHGEGLSIRDLEFDGNVQKLSEGAFLRGGLAMTLNTSCDRCAESFAQQVRDDEVTCMLRQIEAGSGKRPRRTDHEGAKSESDTDDDLAVHWFKGPSFDIGDVILEYVVLAAPLRHLCRTDCKGICQVCGENLNESLCAHAPSVQH
jgi:uncharacterized protein